MSTPSTVHRYRIVVRDDCRDLLASLVEGLAESELYGLLDRFHDLALHIVSLHELEPRIAS